MNIWSPLCGEIIKCKREPTNKEDKNTIAIMRTDSMGDGEESIIRHIPKNISKDISKFLTLPRCSLEAEVTGKMVNRGVDYGLKIPEENNKSIS